VQTNNQIASKPEPPSIIIPEKMEELEILENVAIKTENDLLDENDLAENTNSSGIGLISMMPRQVLEVLPEKRPGELEGKINLYLKIDESGKVVEHKILLNSLKCDDCLKKILSAAYQSRWEPAIRNGRQIIYWIEKTYSFN